MPPRPILHKAAPSGDGCPEMASQLPNSHQPRPDFMDLDFTSEEITVCEHLGLEHSNLTVDAALVAEAPLDEGLQNMPEAVAADREHAAASSAKRTDHQTAKHKLMARAPGQHNSVAEEEASKLAGLAPRP